MLDVVVIVCSSILHSNVYTLLLEQAMFHELWVNCIRDACMVSSLVLFLEAIRCPW